MELTARRQDSAGLVDARDIIVRKTVLFSALVLVALIGGVVGYLNWEKNHEFRTRVVGGLVVKTAPTSEEEREREEIFRLKWLKTKMAGPKP